VRKKSDRPRLHLRHGPVEIERKFLVANDEWRLSAVRSVSIRDGLIAAYEGRKVRVRISGDIAMVAMGIDVSKNTLDASMASCNKVRARSFANSPDGGRHLLDWLITQGDRRVDACLESTGRYTSASRAR
jgi:hypothetical protein